MSLPVTSLLAFCPFPASTEWMLNQEVVRHTREKLIGGGHMRPFDNVRAYQVSACVWMSHPERAQKDARVLVCALVTLASLRTNTFWPRQ